MIRHLLYSVYATKHTGEWILNIQKLCGYKSVFNGKKVIIIRSDENTTDPENVIKHFNFTDAEFVLVRNDRYHETSNFITSLGRFYPEEKNEILFYAHTKGVKYKGNFSQMQAIRNWRNVMYEECLKDPKKIDRMLNIYPCAGCFLKTRPAWAGMKAAKWHFSGNFWWVRLDRLFGSKRWSFVYPNIYAIESYLGTIFDLKEAYNIAHPGDGLSLQRLRDIYITSNQVTLRKTRTRVKHHHQKKTAPLVFPILHKQIALATG